MAKRLSYFLRANHLYFLVFILLFVFSIHNFDSIGQDIGRHLKVGEIIWQIKELPKTNLFSFTEPDFKFINHHWLSEVLIFKIFDLFGFTGLILVKAILIFIAFYIIFLSVYRRSRFWPIIISLLLSIFIFIERSEMRPEIFSFVILSFFIFALLKSKYESKRPYLWFLPIAELLWVNLHIYFFIGPLLYMFFLIDDFVGREIRKFRNFKLIENCKLKIGILALILVATLINPAGIRGALLPFNILNEYGYSIVENQTLLFLSNFSGFNISIFTFKAAVAILILALLFNIKKTKQNIFEIVISGFFIFAGFKMLRNLPLFALGAVPMLSIALTGVQDLAERKFLPITRKSVNNLANITAVALLIGLIYLVVTGRFYELTSSPKKFGFSVPNGLERAVNFTEDNNINGPMFNNFDVGGYLIWRLYPREKVFVDNRPEAYSVKFFQETYKPMQESKEKWTELSEKYDINFIFFGHADATPWGQAFLRDIVKNSKWKIVYINESAIILVKNIDKNSEVISKFSITEGSVINKVADNIKNSNQNKVDSYLVLSRLFYNIAWREASIHFAEKAIKLDPQNSHAYLFKGFGHAYYTDEKNQKLAEENIKKAIDLGLKESSNYTILGVVYMNLGRLASAKLAFQEALKLDKNNRQAKEFITKFFNGKNI